MEQSSTTIIITIAMRNHSVYDTCKIGSCDGASLRTPAIGSLLVNLRSWLCVWTAPNHYQMYHLLQHCPRYLKPFMIYHRFPLVVQIPCSLHREGIVRRRGYTLTILAVLEPVQRVIDDGRLGSWGFCLKFMNLRKGELGACKTYDLFNSKIWFQFNYILIADTVESW